MKKKVFLKIFTFSLLIPSFVFSSCSKNKKLQEQSSENPDTVQFSQEASEDSSFVENQSDLQDGTAEEGSEAEDETGTENVTETEGFDSEIDEEKILENGEELFEEGRIASKENSRFEEESQKIRESFDETKTVENFIGKDGKLLFVSYGDEIVEPEFTKEGLVLIYKNPSEITRNFFDSEYREIKKEYWTISDVENSKITKTERNSYNENEYVPYMKEVETETSLKKSYFNKDSLVYKEEKFELLEEKKWKTSESVWNYDDKNRIKEILTTDYVYQDSKHLKIKDKISKKYVYFYNLPEDAPSDIPPDVDYYENKVLTLRTKYSTQKGTYTSQIFFDKDHSVKTWYENYKIKKEIFFENGNVKRENTYD